MNNEKLIEIQSMINDMQYEINDEKNITNIDDIKMEIFKLWYFVRFDRKYEE